MEFLKLTLHILGIIHGFFFALTTGVLVIAADACRQCMPPASCCSAVHDSRILNTCSCSCYIHRLQAAAAAFVVMLVIPKCRTDVTYYCVISWVGLRSTVPHSAPSL
jgi:hypothetical protein